MAWPGRAAQWNVPPARLDPAALAARRRLARQIAAAVLGAPFGHMPPYACGTTAAVRDMFWNDPFDEAEAVRGCEERWGVTPRPLWAQTEWGGRRIGACARARVGMPVCRGLLLLLLLLLLPLLHAYMCAAPHKRSPRRSVGGWAGKTIPTCSMRPAAEAAGPVHPPTHGHQPGPCRHFQPRVDACVQHALHGCAQHPAPDALSCRALCACLPVSQCPAPSVPPYLYDS